MHCQPLVVIPLYNHGATVAQVVRETLNALPGADAGLLVVDDGSSDNGFAFVEKALAEATGAHAWLVRHDRNKGKGEAIKTATAWAAKHGYTHIVTLDADGQHFPADLPLFFASMRDHPGSIIIGARDFSVPDVPVSSRFGRSFSGFWMRVQTGLSIPDMQSGFRAYPVAVLQSLALHEKRYSFEIEVLVKAAWAGFDIRSIDIRVFYPEASKRVSHFRKLHDNALISMLNTRLTVRALIPLPFTQKNLDDLGGISVLNPVDSLRKLLAKDNTPFTLAFSTFAAVLVNMLPLPGLQTILLLLGISWLRLNRVWALTVSHACWPPVFIPLGIEAGHVILHGTFLTELSWQTIGSQAGQRVLEWVVGGLAFGPLFAFFWGAAVYFLALGLRALSRKESEDSSLV